MCGENRKREENSRCWTDEKKRNTAEEREKETEQKAERKRRSEVKRMKCMWRKQEKELVMLNR